MKKLFFVALVIVFLTIGCATQPTKSEFDAIFSVPSQPIKIITSKPSMDILINKVTGNKSTGSIFSFLIDPRSSQPVPYQGVLFESEEGWNLITLEIAVINRNDKNIILDGNELLVRTFGDNTNIELFDVNTLLKYYRPTKNEKFIKMIIKSNGFDIAYSDKTSDESRTRLENITKIGALRGTSFEIAANSTTEYKLIGAIKDGVKGITIQYADRNSVSLSF